jgi:hypothetical protein
MVEGENMSVGGDHFDGLWDVYDGVWRVKFFFSGVEHIVEGATLSEALIKGQAIYDALSLSTFGRTEAAFEETV